MLGSTISTPGSLEPWYYVVDALQRLPTRLIAVADVSRFCYGTATVECAGVGEAREAADEIVEVPPNTGMVQRHVVALGPGAPICEHGACQSCIDRISRHLGNDEHGGGERVHVFRDEGVRVSIFSCE